MWNIGIVGCGRITQVRHLPEYAARNDVKIAGLYDMNMERAQALAAQYGAKAYPSYEAMLAVEGIHAVSVCSANIAHAEHTLAALKAGKHVLCEKPMAVTLEECESMTRTAEQVGRVLMIGQNQRLAQAHQKARELIRQGRIGKPLTFRTAFRHAGPETWSIDSGKGTWFFDKDKAVMGALADLGIHKTDLIQFLLDQTIVEVSARLSTLDKRFNDGSLIGVDDHAVCIYQMSGGAVGTMTASWINYGPEDNATVIGGTLGQLRIYDDPARPLIWQGRNGEEESYQVEDIQTNDRQTKSGVIDLFIETLNGGPVESIPASSVLPAMRAVFACIESSRTGRSLPVNRA